MISFVHRFLQRLIGFSFFLTYFLKMKLRTSIKNCGHEIFICQANFSVQQVSVG